MTDTYYFHLQLSSKFKTLTLCVCVSGGYIIYIYIVSSGINEPVFCSNWIMYASCTIISSFSEIKLILTDQFNSCFDRNFTSSRLWLTGHQHQTAEPWISRTELVAKLAQGVWPQPPNPIGIAENVWGNWLWRRLIWTRFVWTLWLFLCVMFELFHTVNYHSLLSQSLTGWLDLVSAENDHWHCL